jgi:RNA polymerase sigma-70 factor (ECF subfamily)
MAQELSSEELLAQAAERNLDAFGALYDRHAPQLLGLLTRITANRELGEEVLQDVFARAWNEAGRLQEAHTSVGVWLGLTARRAALDRLRGEGNNPANPAAAENLDPRSSRASGKAATKKPKAAAHSAAAKATQSTMATLPLGWLPPPEETTRLDRRLGLLQKVLSQLPKAQRTALELAVFTGSTENEIAQELGEPLAKVKTLLRGGMTFLRHRLHAVLGTWAANI